MENSSSVNHSSDQAVRETISVIIPTLNGGEALRELLAALTIQSMKPAEVIVVDSDSDDDSRTVAELFGAQVTRIKRTDYDHGGTRSEAAIQAAGTIVVFLTQDVLPRHPLVLENLVRPLIEEHDVAVSYGRQLPAFDAGPMASHLRLFNYPEKSCIRRYEDRTRYGLETIFASNSCAAYRKNVLEEIGFFGNRLIFGEDTCAVGRLVKKGYKVAYCADAEVYHSHNYRWGDEFRRYFDIGVFHTSEKWLIDSYGSAEGRGRRYLKSGLIYLLNRRKYSVIGDFMVRIVLKYIGYKLGRHYQLIPGKMRPGLSLNRDWWNR